ncbi:hypothetical protein [Paenibacillus hubeiensis]
MPKEREENVRHLQFVDSFYVALSIGTGGALIVHQEHHPISHAKENLPI